MRNLVSKSSVFYLPADIYGDYEEYKDEFKKVIREREHRRILFLHQSPQMSFRKFLVHYLKEVCILKQLSQSCLHLTVYLLDIFMDNHNIMPDRLQLVANVCLLLAAKIEENNSEVPKISELMNLVNQRFGAADYITIEQLVLKFFDFYIKFPCAVHYVFYYTPEIISFDDVNNERNFRTLFYDVYDVVIKYLDQILEDIHYMQYYPPSVLAAAVIAASRYGNGLSAWSSQLEELSGYRQENFDEVMSTLLKYVHNV